MDLSKRRAGVRSSVVAGSVWESRMKGIDEVKGGVKVSENSEESAAGGDSKPRMKKTQTGVVGGTVAVSSGKRKTWKSESFDGSDKNAFQIVRQRSDLSKSCDEQSKNLSASTEGVRKTPIQVKKGRSDAGKDSNGNERSPIQLRKSRSEMCKDVVESGEGIQKSPAQLRKVKSESANGNGRNSPQMRKIKTELPKDSDENRKETEILSKDSAETEKETENIPVETEKNDGSDENCKEFEVCEEKLISSSETNVDVAKSAPEELTKDEDDAGVDDDNEEEEGYEDVEEEELTEEFEVETEKKAFDIKEIQLPEQTPKKVTNGVKEIIVSDQKPKKVFNEVKKFHQINTRTVPNSTTVKQQPPSIKRPTMYQNFAKPTPAPSPAPAQYQNFPETTSKLQNLVDLVMWRDVSRSAFVFGLGTFVIISSSYTQDLNISFISVMSYVGLVYLAAIFLYRSIICRGVINVDGTNYVVGEDEAVWLLTLILPYLNEFLLKIKALFSGDPSTTMKLAVLLFVLARCGNSITIWKMAKVGFFGVFTVPKVCQSYSHQLTAYGKFWIRRFRDAWDSCSHKKAVAIAIFTLVWNLSSVVARVWAVFMLFVALRYYQQSMVAEELAEQNTDTAGRVEETQMPFRRRRSAGEFAKEKKAF